MKNLNIFESLDKIAKIAGITIPLYLLTCAGYGFVKGIIKQINIEKRDREKTNKAIQRALDSLMDRIKRGDVDAFDQVDLIKACNEEITFEMIVLNESK